MDSLTGLFVCLFVCLFVSEYYDTMKNLSRHWVTVVTILCPSWIFYVNKGLFSLQIMQFILLLL